MLIKAKFDWELYVGSVLFLIDDVAPLFLFSFVASVPICAFSSDVSRKIVPFSTKDNLSIIVVEVY